MSSFSDQEYILNKIMFFPDAFIKMALKHYPFTLVELNELKDMVDWKIISGNENILWDKELLFAFKDKLDWEEISINSSVFRNLSLIDTFINEIQWECKTYELTIAVNDGIQWDIPLIEKYKHLIDFYQLSQNCSVEWSIEIFDRYKDKLYFHDILYYSGLPVTAEMFDFFTKNISYCDMDISECYFFINDPQIISRNDHFDYWGYIIYNNNLPWDKIDLFTLWKDKVDWKEAVGHKFLVKNSAFINTHIEYWLNYPNYNQQISLNSAVNWTTELIEKHKESWDWRSLSINSGLPWDMELIKKYKDKWEWGYYVKEYHDVDVQGNSVPPPHKSYLKTIYGFESNTNIDWSVELIMMFEYQINFDLLFDNLTVWEKVLKKYVNLDVIKNII